MVDEDDSAPPGQDAELRKNRDYLIPIAIGLVAFFVVLGWKILVPTNIAWLASSDPATFYLSWSFFRHTPWTLPPGANPDYGMVGSSIFYGDALPLVALVLKLFSSWLPASFQYFGLWLLGCFVLQAVLAWTLVDVLVRERWVKILATVLFVFSPPFLFRLQFHYSLCAHWLLLAALYLCLGPPRRLRLALWPALAFLAAGIHSYILAMIAVLWTADAVRRLIMREAGLGLLAVEGALCGFFALLMLWAAGFFVVHHGFAATGLGLAGMNLLAPLNPRNAFGAPKWSYLLPNLPSENLDYEGFNFLGLGVLFLLGFCLFHYRRHREDFRVSRQQVPLLVALAGLTIFAFSNHVALGPYHLFAYPLPHIAGALRGSGRMFWPAFYAGIFFLLRSLLRHYSARTVLLVLGIAVVAQMVDTSSGWLSLRHEKNTFYGSDWPTAMKSSFWTQAALRYRRIYVTPEIRYPDLYRSVAFYAVGHDMATDAAYLARMDSDFLKAHQRQVDSEVATGHYDGQALYILDGPHAALAAKSMHPDRDLLTTIDGMIVLAPDWKSGSPAPAVPAGT